MDETKSDYNAYRYEIVALPQASRELANDFLNDLFQMD